MAVSKETHDIVKQLTGASARLRELAPWKTLGSAQLLAATDPEQSETIYFSSLGKDGEAHGLMIYEGREGLDSFLLGQDSFTAGIPYETLLLHETAMCCYLGDPGKLTADQKLKLYLVGCPVDESDEWTCFRTLKMGRGAQLPTAEEAARIVRYLQLFEAALEEYRRQDLQLNYEAGDLYLYDPAASTGRVLEGALYASMPNYVVKVPEIPARFLEKLQTQPRSEQPMQASVFALGLCIRDGETGTLCYPIGALVANSDASSVFGSARALGELGAQETLILALAEAFTDEGLPAELRVGDELAYAAAKQLCDPLDVPVVLTQVLDMRDLEIRFKETLGLD